MDFVLIVKPEAATCSQAVLALELRRRLERLSAHRNKRG
jgi:RNase P protein component